MNNESVKFTYVGVLFIDKKKSIFADTFNGHFESIEKLK